MGEAPGMEGTEAHSLQKFTTPLLPFGTPGQFVDVQGLTDNVANGHAGVQRTVGVLEDVQYFLA